jgi:cytidyltransferase-like protein
MRFLEEAARLGELTVLLWPDAVLEQVTGKTPKFSFLERSYFVNAIRYVSKVVEADTSGDSDCLPRSLSAEIWADYGLTTNPAREKYARHNNIAYRVFSDENLNVMTDAAAVPCSSGSKSNRKKIVVTGCYDWLHSGHVRFFEEVCSYGDLYVVVGHDANIRLLKGHGHPLLSQEERRYMVGSIKYVTQALISSGDGWLDADPEIRGLQPDVYAVNDDGDVGGKRAYCGARGIEYLVLKRIPAPGLPKRNSTDLRGF